MHLDVIDLKAFYDRTTLGRTAQRLVRARMKDIWSDLRGQTLVGFGFSVPVLGQYRATAKRVISLMPAQQGVSQWPDRKANASVLCTETSWPLQAGFADRLVVMHGLETSNRPDALLDEIWRVLEPGGRVVFIVPNRLGLWSRRDVTPFGYGRPYSLGQLETQLRRHRFVPESHKAALFLPPTQKRFWLKMAPVWERAGRSISSHLAGGVLIVEASKQVYAPTKRGASLMVRSPLGVLEGIRRPEPKPASGRVSGQDIQGLTLEKKLM